MKILKDNFQNGQPVASVDANWYNTVAKILNTIQGYGCTITKTQTGLGWTITVPKQSVAELNYPFKMSRYNDTQLNITSGRWTRNGIVVTHTSAGIGDITISTDGIYFVYAKLENPDVVFPGLIPREIHFYYSSTYPLEESEGCYAGEIWVLGQVEREDGKWKKITQWWVGGNIDDFWVKPDSDTVYTRTIERNATNNTWQLRHVGVVYNHMNKRFIPVYYGNENDLGWVELLAQCLEFDSSSSPEGIGEMRFRNWHTPSYSDSEWRVLGRGEITNELEYVPKAALADWIERELIIHSSQIVWDTVTFSHEDLIFDKTKPAGIAGQNTDHDARYWVRGAGYQQNHGTSIGSSDDVMCINLESHMLMSSWTVENDFSVWGTYYSQNHMGGTSNGKKIYLYTEEGELVSYVVRGGILCVD